MPIQRRCFWLVKASVQSSINSTPRRACSDAAIIRGWKSSSTQQSLYNQVPIHSWVERVNTCSGGVLCPTTHHTRRPRPVSETSRSKVAAVGTAAGRLCIYSVHARYSDSEVGHCQGACRPQWFFNVSVKLSEAAPPFMWSCKLRNTVCPMLTGEEKISTSLFCNGTRTRATALQASALQALWPVRSRLSGARYQTIDTRL